MKKPSRNDVVAVVDDDPGVLQALADAFHLFGLRSARYTNAELLLQSLHPRQPILVTEEVPGFPVVQHLVGVVLDLNLPGLTGLEAARRLRARFPDLPMAVITALRPAQFATFGDWPKDVAYLRKPFDLDALEAALPQLLAEQALHGEHQAAGTLMPPPHPGAT